MAMIAQGPYKQQDFKLMGLKGLSDQQIAVHLELYAGYVKNTNLLNERIADLIKRGKTATPEFAEITRRLGFEYNGMILHEYYFGSLKTGGSPFNPNSTLARSFQQSFGGYDAWLNDFRGIATMRGVGWAILYQDPANGWLSNHWITLHQDGHPAGFKPILILDIWEHAFLIDYKPSERSKYIDAFFQNLDWTIIEQRLTSQSAIRPIAA